METITKNIGIFILNHNGIEWLKQTIPNILQHSSYVDIIIIDNHSTDQSVNYIKTNFTNIEVKINTENYGFSKGYNQVLLSETRYKYFIVLNNDVKVTHNWIAPLIATMERENVGIVQPKIMNANKKDRFDYAGGAGGFIDVMGIPFCRGRLLHNLELDNGQYNDNQNIFWASGCCFMIESKLFQRLDGFDEDLFMHQEEIDLCWRAQKINKTVNYCSQSTIYHYGGGTLKMHNPIKYYYNHRNNLLILIKNLPLYSLSIVLPIRLIIDYLIISFYFIVGLLYIIFTLPLHVDKRWQPEEKYGIKKIKISFWIVLAHVKFLILLRKFIKKRSPIETKHIYPRSIIFDFFIQERKRFSDLKKF